MRHVARFWVLLFRALAAWAIGLGMSGGLLGVAAAATYNYYSRDLPEPGAIGQRYDFQTTRIFDRNGVLLYEFYDGDRGKRVALPLAQVPTHVVSAFLAAEDARFFEHPGVDVQAILRAAFDNAQSGGTQLTGGSTITQQVIKNGLLSDERTLSRKIREAILAINLSRRYDKRQILELYLNTVYLGSQAYGVQAAAETYFGKPVQQLTLAEAAVLAGLPPAPSTVNPFADPDATKREQGRVLDQMVRHGFLTADQAAHAAQEPLSYAAKPEVELKAPHFALWVREQLEQNPRFKDGIFKRALNVTTTLDYRMQEMAELIVREHVAGLGKLGVSDGALVALNPATGEILAMVGSADFANKSIKGEVNVALALRQPGSAIKPVTYLAAVNAGWSPLTIVEDGPTTFPTIPPYAPKNYDGGFHGKVTVRTALANSYNIPAVKALQAVGVPALFDLGRRMGITTFEDPSKYGLAATLGGVEVRLLDLAGAYGVLASGGRRVAPVSILKIADTNGNVLESYAGPRAAQVTDAARAYMITSILMDNDARTPAFGPNSPLKLSRPVAAKTGTTDDFKDNWTLGYTSQLVTGVWVGNADNAQMRGTTGLTGAAPIWHDFMEYALAPLPVDPLPAPAGLTKVAVARESGKLWVEGCPEAKLEDYVLPGQVPRERCEKPTPVPTPTADAIATLGASLTARTPRPTGTALPSVEELRERAAMTATASSAYAATMVADRRATATALPTATPFPRTGTSAEVAGAQVQRSATPAQVATTPTAVSRTR